MVQKKILYIENDSLTRELMATVLTAEGYQVIPAENAFDGLNKFHKEQPDLVLLDVVMPHISGYDFCKLIKGDPELRETPIMVYTALEHPDDQDKAMEYGVDAWMSKPGSLSQVLSLIEQVTSEAKTV